jgi:hypothetical protein
MSESKCSCHAPSLAREVVVRVQTVRNLPSLFVFDSEPDAIDVATTTAIAITIAIAIAIACAAAVIPVIKHV